MVGRLIIVVRVFRMTALPILLHPDIQHYFEQFSLLHSSRTFENILKISWSFWLIVN